MANRLRSAVKTRTITIMGLELDPNNPDDEGREFVALQYETRSQGHGAIIRTAVKHDGIDELIEDFVDNLVKQAKSRGLRPGEVVENAITGMSTDHISVGAIIAKVVTNAPDLVLELLADGFIYEGDETREDFIGFFDSLSVSQIKSAVEQWYKFNIKGQIRPFVKEVQALAQKRKVDLGATGRASAPVAARPMARPTARAI